MLLLLTLRMPASTDASAIMLSLLSLFPRRLEDPLSTDRERSRRAPADASCEGGVLRLAGSVPDPLLAAARDASRRPVAEDWVADVVPALGRPDFLSSDSEASVV